MLTEDQKSLLRLAEEASTKAYAPYSKYPVGAAVLTEKGIYTGANIENACTNLGICAERVALAHAHMQDGGKVLAVAVFCKEASKDSDGNIKAPAETMPCGGCRQWLAELAPDATVIANGFTQVFTVKDLLPNPFSLPDSAD